MEVTIGSIARCQKRRLRFYVSSESERKVKRDVDESRWNESFEGIGVEEIRARTLRSCGKDVDFGSEKSGNLGFHTPSQTITSLVCGFEGTGKHHEVRVW